MALLSGEVALVTGASRRLGKAIAQSLAAAGARVVVNYKAHDADARQVVAGIQNAGGEAMAVCADITSQYAIHGMVATVEATWGPITILVNNATGPQPMKAIEDYTWQDYLDQLHYFVKAPLELTQRVLPAMKAAQKGRIINIGSEVVDLGNAYYSAYVTAKAAMIGFTRSWASELGPNGITVNLVAPGWIPGDASSLGSPDNYQPYLGGVLLGHMGVPEDIGAAVVFFASPMGKFVTGQVLSVNGGKTF